MFVIADNMVTKLFTL